MGISFIMAVLVAFVGVVPLMFFSKFKAAAIMAFSAFLPLWGIFYAGTPSMVWPMFGATSLAVLGLWIITAFVDGSIEGDFTHAMWFPIALFLIFVLRWGGGCGCFRSSDYAKLIGDFQEKEWTQDVQPASAKHIRLVPFELASFLADKQLAQAPGAIGSQFFVDKNHGVIQMIKGDFWWIFPLEYSSFSVWSATDYAPGYLMVHADDPNFQPVLKYEEKFVYTPGAYFSKNLERHLWNNGYLNKGLTDYTLEIDEIGKPWWVVTVYEPTIAYWGNKMIGIVTVHPTSGEIYFYSNDKIPTWVDRAFPGNFISYYITKWGDYKNGWKNSWWDKKDLIEPEPREFVYGSDGEPYWVTRITSQSEKDQAVVGMFYTNSRTGKTIKYHAVGATDSAILNVVKSKLEAKRWSGHGVSPTIYNVYGVMTSVVPILSSTHVFQGVALVNVENQQAVVAENLTDAFREYQRLLAGGGNQMAPETAHNLVEVKGVVDRFANDVRNGNMIYYIHLVDVPHLFTGGSDNLVTPKLTLTKAGDEVVMSYIPSGEDVVPIMKFDNTSLQLKTTPNQDAVREMKIDRQVEAAIRKDTTDGRAAVQEMSDLEIRNLLKLHEQLKSRSELPYNIQLIQ